MKNENNLNEIIRSLLEFDETKFILEKTYGVPDKLRLTIKTEINNGSILVAKIEMDLKFDFGEVILQAENIAIKNNKTFNLKIDSVIDYFNKHKNEVPKIMSHLSEFNGTETNYAEFGSFVYENRIKILGTKFGT